MNHLIKVCCPNTSLLTVAMSADGTVVNGKPVLFDAFILIKILINLPVVSLTVMLLIVINVGLLT